MESKFHIGTSGFTYKHWQGLFYPEDIQQRQWLEYYAEHFDTVEINSTFYHLPRPSTCENWNKRVPEDFVYVIKASRFITHLKKLEGVDQALENFFEVIRHLGQKLGPILFQLPPSLKKNLPLLGSFLATLPQGYSYVFEFRNSDWYDDDLFSLLDNSGAAFCIHDLPGRASPVAATGSFAYVRFHGAQKAYSSRYSDQELETWAGRLQGYAQKGLDVYAYFNNDIGGHAVENAKTLKSLLAHTAL